MTEGRELFGHVVPWTVWQWAFRWVGLQRQCTSIPSPAAAMAAIAAAGGGSLCPAPAFFMSLSGAGGGLLSHPNAHRLASNSSFRLHHSAAAAGVGASPLPRSHPSSSAHGEQVVTSNPTTIGRGAALSLSSTAGASWSVSKCFEVQSHGVSPQSGTESTSAPVQRSSFLGALSQNILNNTNSNARPILNDSVPRDEDDIHTVNDDEEDMDEDEEEDGFGSATSWLDETIARTSLSPERQSMKTIQLPPLQCALLPSYLGGMGNPQNM